MVKKKRGGHRLVTSFGEVGRYAKPQPALTSNIDSILYDISQWKHIICSDLSKAYFKIPLSHSSRKFCGVSTPYRGVRVYCRAAMGMPGSESALEELMCKVIRNFIQQGQAAKLADNLYVGGNTPEEFMPTGNKFYTLSLNAILNYPLTKLLSILKKSQFSAGSGIMEH